MPSAHDDAATVLSESTKRELATTPEFSVTVAAGPDTGVTATVDATTQRLLVGTSASCELRLTDREVSRRHLALEVADGDLRLVDLGSSNGTFVGGIKVTECALRGGETLRIGATTLRVERTVESKRVPISTADRFGRLIGASVEMRRLYPYCERLATTDVPVVIEGETGTGKEVLAESIHELGHRASGPFVVFDCTAVPPSLVEAELFGYERGAFTGAVASRKGVFELAHGGTLLIDEVGDLDLALQPKLLRAIQRREIRRLGADHPTTVDVRILGATRRDLDHEVQTGRFRDDLFFRLAVARIELPPLRTRRGDVAQLAAHFWEELGGTGAFPYDVLARWEEYRWPGNVRELHNEVARQIALGELPHDRGKNPTHEAPLPETPPTPAASSPDFIDAVVSMGLPLTRARDRVVEEFQRRYVQHLVDKHGGNVTHAARASGVAYRYFQLLRSRQRKT